MNAERRRHARCAPMVGYALTCRLAERHDGPSLASRLIDVAPGGVCLETTKRLFPGSRLVVEIRLPGDADRFRAEGVVTWAGAQAAGVRFESVDESADLPEPAVTRSSEPRRRHKRFFPGRGDVVFAPRTLWTSLGFRPRDVALRIVDLSLGGVHLVCGRRLETGATGTMTLDFYRPRVTVEGEVRVVWCRRDTLKLAPEWHVGLSYRRLSDPESVHTLHRQFLG